ncbi:MAG: class I SAM-dependent RNA methyltransferase [Pseudomonadota bacterium]
MSSTNMSGTNASGTNLPGTWEIIDLDAAGDGVTADGQTVIGALPGEHWRTPSSATERVFDAEYPHRVGAAASDRIKSLCRHHAECGGCVAQHMAPYTYAGWKHRQLTRALTDRKLSIDCAELWQAPLGSRRRLTLEAANTMSGVTIGLSAARAHTRFDMNECPVADPSLVAALTAIRTICGHLLTQGATARLTLTATSDGNVLDIAARSRDIANRALTRGQIGSLAAAHVVQATLDGDILSTTAPPALQLAGCRVPLPRGSFVQAVPQAEEKMQALVCAALAGHKRVGDLFCGLGTFTLAVARKSTVMAYDSDAPAITALTETARGAPGLKPVTATRRDLFRDPLAPAELRDIRGVVMNPPRAGAQAQTRSLAQSAVETVVMVSCNPVTFARDAATLIEAGFTAQTAHPIDQFLFSPHLEVVCAFTRRRGAGRRMRGRSRSPAR